MIRLRRPVTVALSLLCIFLLYNVWQSIEPVLPQQPARNVYHPASKFAEGTFDWAKLEQHYPVTSFAPLPRPAELQGLPRVQHAFGPESDEARSLRLSRQTQVKQALARCWTAYRERAWLSDELTPISGGNRTTFGGWAATLVDSLDTLWIMGMREEFDEAVNATLQIDFTTSSMQTINIFETTIRYLGGFISAYDLSGDVRLLDKSIELAEMIYHAFDTPNRMPVARWRLLNKANGIRQEADTRTSSAEIGSLQLELTRLTQITGDPRWYDAGKRIMDIFARSQGKTRVAGMWPITVNAKRVDFFSGTTFTLGAMADSLYEYLPKMFALLGGDNMYKKLYIDAMDAVIKNTLYRPMLPDQADVLITGTAYVSTPFYPPELKSDGSHLSCFAGAMFALGGRLLQRPSDIAIGRKLTDGCIWTYDNSPLGIMPEGFTMAKCASTPTEADNDDCPWDETVWKSGILLNSGNLVSKATGTTAATYAREHRIPKGFTSISDRRYLLRPEAIESVFYLYRITGDVGLMESAWRMFEAVQKSSMTELANGAIADVTDLYAPKIDSMESFWPAETLKYYYLVFSEPELVSLDYWVFNTEAHPFRRPNNPADSLSRAE